ncbi:MAG: hypothetical protein UT02_C0061G0005 [Parcubacteria group bacterium GW2011_GWC2_38_7]|nr:MAG: hypothetical protein UT02_C0061G0005 [Parcubacteria group bacterium GW2011_GWC2_38_7]
MRYLVIALLLVVLSGCTLINKEEAQVQDSDFINPALSPSPVDAGGDDALVRKYIPYTNEKYSFELKLPGEWEGFSSEERALNWGDLGASDSIDFGFMQNEALESLFNISIHSVSQWEKISASEGPVPTALGDKNGIVIAWSGGQDASEVNMARRSQVDEIVASFKWVEEK